MHVDDEARGRISAALNERLESTDNLFLCRWRDRLATTPRLATGVQYGTVEWYSPPTSVFRLAVTGGVLARVPVWKSRVNAINVCEGRHA